MRIVQCLGRYHISFKLEQQKLVCSHNLSMPVAPVFDVAGETDFLRLAVDFGDFCSGRFTLLDLANVFDQERSFGPIDQTSWTQQSSNSNKHR